MDQVKRSRNRGEEVGTPQGRVELARGARKVVVRAAQHEADVAVSVAGDPWMPIGTAKKGIEV